MCTIDYYEPHKTGIIYRMKDGVSVEVIVRILNHLCSTLLYRQLWADHGRLGVARQLHANPKCNNR